MTSVKKFILKVGEMVVSTVFMLSFVILFFVLFLADYPIVAFIAMIGGVACAVWSLFMFSEVRELELEVE